MKLHLKEIELKKISTVIQNLNFWELDELEEKMKAVREAKFNKMKVDKKSSSNKHDKEEETGDLHIGLD